MAEGTANVEVCADYVDPVGRLLTIGKTGLVGPTKWPDYPVCYQLGRDDISALIKMACDLTLNTDDSDGPGIWAPVHAWRALGQLRAVEAVEPLLEFLKSFSDDDFAASDLPTVLGMIGAAAIPAFTALLADRTIGSMLAASVMDGLAKLVGFHPEYRDECVGILTRELKQAAETDPNTNAFAISSLLDLAAVEAIDTIREAFRRDVVDLSVAGDLEDVEIALGLREHRVTSKPYYPFLSTKSASPKWLTGTGFSDGRRDADELPLPAKAGRNEPCPCGSGKKYKKCCLV